MEKIKVIRVRPGQEPETIETENEYENIRSLVCNAEDGYIEVVYPWEDPVALICDEEGKIKGREANRILEDESGKAYDILVGPFLIVGLAGDSFASLPEELIKKYTEKFRWPEYFYRWANQLFVCTKRPGEEPRSLWKC